MMEFAYRGALLEQVYDYFARRDQARVEFLFVSVPVDEKYTYPSSNISATVFESFEFHALSYLANAPFTGNPKSSN